MSSYLDELSAQVGLTKEQGQTKVHGKYEGETEVALHTICTAVDALGKYTLLIDPIRALAKSFGYAIGVHGSLKRDIDLIAIPWTEDAVEDEILAAGIINLVRAFSKDSWTHVSPAGDKGKPHGRRCWSIFVTSRVYIDLSIMPRILKDESTSK